MLSTRLVARCGRTRLGEAVSACGRGCYSSYVTDAREANQEAGKLRGQVSSLQGALDSTSMGGTQGKDVARWVQQR